MQSDHDQSSFLAERVHESGQDGRRLALTGQGVHRHQSFPDPLPADVDWLSTQQHRGIVTLLPSELVVTVRSGTPVTELCEALAQAGMMLPFEPALPDPQHTVGGMIALGLSGPRRPWTASLRDALLGTRIVNGHGEILHFGGEVMKNVAGFDVSRLMSGSLGAFGLLLEASFKLLPQPIREICLQREESATTFIHQSRDQNRTALPFSGLAWQEGIAHIRLSGGEDAVTEAARHIGGEIDHDGAFWKRLRDRQLPLFSTAPKSTTRLWRISLPAATAPLDLPGDWLLNWGGGERWLRSIAPPESIRNAVTQAGGHARLWAGDATGVSRLQPRGTGLERLEARLRRALDPEGVFHSPLLPTPARPV